MPSCLLSSRLSAGRRRGRVREVRLSTHAEQVTVGTSSHTRRTGSGIKRDSIASKTAKPCAFFARIVPRVAVCLSLPS